MTPVHFDVEHADDAENGDKAKSKKKNQLEAKANLEMFHKSTSISRMAGI